MAFEDVAKVCSEIVPTKRNSELIKTLALQEQLLLVALYTLFKEGDNLNVEMGQLAKQVKWVTGSLSLDTLADAIKQKLDILSWSSFVALKRGKGKLLVTIKLLMADVEEAFEQHPLFGRFFA